jgi:methionyl-tRNA synthetase
VEITCPACRKHNPNADCCARCGADLLPLVHTHQAAQQFLEEGRQYLKRRQGSHALRAAIRSWLLQHSAEAAGLAFLACLHQHKFDAATQWYQRAHHTKVGSSHRPKV